MPLSSGVVELACDDLCTRVLVEIGSRGAVDNIYAVDSGAPGFHTRHEFGDHSCIGAAVGDQCLQECVIDCGNRTAITVEYPSRTARDQ